ncbi:MAG: hypothetical protein ACK5FE_05440 [Cyanobacteriota bacterium]
MIDITFQVEDAHQAAGLFRTVCSIGVWIGTLGTGTAFNYYACMSKNTLKPDGIAARTPFALSRQGV